MGSPSLVVGARVKVHGISAPCTVIGHGHDDAGVYVEVAVDGRGGTARMMPGYVIACPA